MTQTHGRSAMLRLSALVGERTLFENDAYRKLWLTKLLAHPNQRHRLHHADHGRERDRQELL